MIILTTQSPEETKEVGQRLGELLQKGDIVAVVGELGSGKTCLIQGICKGLKVEEEVTSPSFTIINEYCGKFPVYHFDFYRINHLQEALELGYEEYFFGNGVTLIEWAEKIELLLPEDHIKVQIFRKNEKLRELTIKAGVEETKKRIASFFKDGQD